MAKGTNLFSKVLMALTFVGIGAFASAASADEAPGDRCAPQIANNAAAAGVCTPICEKAGLKFAGNWSNQASHPPVQACKAKNEGQSVCGCAAVPGDRCSPAIANNAAAAGVCGPVCEKAGLKFAGNWSNQASHPPVKACKDKKEGQSVCGCASK